MLRLATTLLCFVLIMPPETQAAIHSFSASSHHSPLWRQMHEQALNPLLIWMKNPLQGFSFRTQAAALQRADRKQVAMAAIGVTLAGLFVLPLDIPARETRYFAQPIYFWGSAFLTGLPFIWIEKGRHWTLRWLTGMIFGSIPPAFLLAAHLGILARVDWALKSGLATAMILYGVYRYLLHHYPQPHSWMKTTEPLQNEPIPTTTEEVAPTPAPPILPASSLPAGHNSRLQRALRAKA